MKTQATNEAAAAHADRQSEGAGRTMQLQNAARTAVVDNRPAAGTLARYQQLSNSSPHAAQLKRQTAQMATDRMGTSSPVSPGSALPVQRKVGFEFQMLDSDIELKDRNKNVNKVTWAGKQGWHLEMDGKNAEFVVKPVETPDQAVRQVAEVAQVADLIKSKGRYKDTGAADNKARTLDVLEPDTQGQPQVNADVGLDSFLAGTKGYVARDAAASQPYFGVERAAFKWNPTTTNAMMDRVDAIKTRMRAFSDDDLLDHLQHGIGSTVPVAFAKDGELAKAVKLSRSYCVLEASIRETAPTNKGLTKDMPVLPKTNLKDIEKEILALLASGLAGVPRVGAQGGEKLALNLADAFGEILYELQKASGSERKNPDVFEETGSQSELGESRHVYGVKFAKKVSNQRKHSLLLEYRRIPISHTSEWVNFARKAAGDFGALD
jgi:hypothetical protein